jgi:hypothetical protein
MVIISFIWPPVILFVAFITPFVFLRHFVERLRNDDDWSMH